MSPRTLIVATLALVFGVSASVGVNNLRKSPAASTEKPDTVVVPVAGIHVKRGEKITEEMLVGREWPREIVPPGAILKKANIVGKIATVPLVKNEPIFSGKVGESERFSGLIKEGFRAYTILTPNDASLVAGLIEPGDKVDVLFTDRSSDEELTGGGSTTPLLQHIEVLAIGQIVDPSESRETNSRDMRSVTLLVPLDMATKLALAQEMGTLHLALRAEHDTSTAKASAVTMTELLRSAYPALFTKDEQKEGSRVTPAVAVATEPSAPPQIAIRTLRGTAPSTVVMRASLSRGAAVPEKAD